MHRQCRTANKSFQHLHSQRVNVTYLQNMRTTAIEWQLSVWKAHDIAKQMIAPAKKNENTTFSCKRISVFGLVMNQVASSAKATQPEVIWLQNELPQNYQQRKIASRVKCHWYKKKKKILAPDTLGATTENQWLSHLSNESKYCQFQYVLKEYFESILRSLAMEDDGHDVNIHYPVAILANTQTSVLAK